MSRLLVVPISHAEANAYVREHHRHAGPVVGMKFALGVAEEPAWNRILGVALVGRPVARHLDDGWTLEVNRLCTQGARDTGSFLYAASWRATKALGYRRLVTYTLESESGASLRGAGWLVIGRRAPRRGWDMPARPRPAAYLSTQRTLWEAPR